MVTTSVSVSSMLTARGYRGLDHAVSMEEFSDLRQWLLDQDIASGII